MSTIKFPIVDKGPDPTAPASETPVCPASVAFMASYAGLHHITIIHHIVHSPPAQKPVFNMLPCFLRQVEQEDDTIMTKSTGHLKDNIGSCSSAVVRPPAPRPYCTIHVHLFYLPHHAQLLEYAISKRICNVCSSLRMYNTVVAGRTVG